MIGMTKAGSAGALAVDCHVHLLMPDWNPGMREGLEGLSDSWARQVRWYYGPKMDPAYLAASIAECWDGTGERLVARMDDAGIDTSILMPMDHTWVFPEPDVIPIEEKNRLCREAGRRHPGRIFTFAGVDPRRPNAVAIIREAFEDGAVGLKLYPTNGFAPDDEEHCYPLYALCEEYDRPVLFHTGHSAGRQKSKYSHPMLVDSAAADWPEVRFIMGHSGRFEAWSREALAVAVYKTNTYLDLSLWQHFISPDELVRQIVWMRDRIGLDRVMFGSDMVGIDVSLSLKEWADLVRSLPEWANQLGFRLLPEEIDMVLGESCAACYRLPEVARTAKRDRAAG